MGSLGAAPALLFDPRPYRLVAGGVARTVAPWVVLRVRGPLHLADAVGTPAIGLFGGYNVPKMWHPSGPRTHIIHHMAGLSTILPGDVASVALASIRPGVR